MNVYILEANWDYESSDIIGVFSDIESAMFRGTIEVQKLHKRDHKPKKWEKRDHFMLLNDSSMTLTVTEYEVQ